MVLPRAACAFREVVLEVRVAARSLGDAVDRLLGEWRAAEVRVDDDARGVEHAPQARPPCVCKLRAEASREISRIRSGLDLLAGSVDHRSRRVDRERVARFARELVNGGQVTQLHRSKRYCASAFSGSCGLGLPSPARKASSTVSTRDVGVVGERQERKILGRDHPVGESAAAHPLEQRRPVRLADEHDREVEDLAGLDQGERLEQLVGRAEAAGEDAEALRGLHEHRLAGVEVVEDEAEVDVVVHPLLVRQLDSEADREPAAFAAAAVRRLHHAGTAARDDGPACLREEARRFAGELVGPRSLRHAGRAEAGNRRAVDLLDLLEAGQELLSDRLRLLPEVLERVVGLEKVAILHRLEHPAVPRGEHSADERGREQNVERSDQDGVLPVRRQRLDRHAVLEPDLQPLPGVRHGARTTVPPSRKPIGSRLNALSRKPTIGEHDEPGRVREPSRTPTPRRRRGRRRSGPASEMSALRHGGVLGVAHRDVGAEEGDERGQRDGQALPPWPRATWPSSCTRISSTKPSPNCQLPNQSGVRGERDEEEEELRESAGQRGDADEPVEDAPPLFVCLRAHDPRPIHSSPPA